MLTISDLTYRIAGRTLLENVSLSIPAGHHVGLVGPNGTGKSTLFKLITNELHADGGEINLLKGLTLGVVRQDLPEDETSLLDVVLNSHKERAALLHEAETAVDPYRIGYIYTRLEEIGSYDAPARAATILSGLGFDDEAQQKSIKEFSGGWRARVALAAALFLKPDYLLLDEPTNHLDFEAMVWLESFLQRYEGALIIISHDRDILNKTVDTIIHLDNKKLVTYTGTYDMFERKRAERQLGQQALFEKQQAMKAKMMAFVERFRAKASKASQAQSRLKMIEKMDVVDAVIQDRITSFVFPEPEELRSPLITLNSVSVGYDTEKPVLQKLNLRIDNDDRIALLGANGNGKSTLVKLLSGRLEAMHGDLHKSGKLKVGYFAQFQTDELDINETPFEIMRKAMGKLPEAKVRAAISRFGFDKHKADTKVGELSGGEKARLLFCLMSYDAPHIMLLDEPTNHLDIDAREALMQALNNYNGAVILVSHDPHLVECVADRLWLVADGTCKNYDGNLEDYRSLIVEQRRKERQKARDEQRIEKQNKKGKKAKSTEKDIKKLEEEIIGLTEEKEKLENELAVLFTKPDSEKLKKLTLRFDKVQADLKQAEQRYETLLN